MSVRHGLNKIKQAEKIGEEINTVFWEPTLLFFCEKTLKKGTGGAKFCQ